MISNRADDERRRLALKAALKLHRDALAHDDEPINRHAAVTAEKVDQLENQVRELRHWIFGLAIAVLTTGALGVAFR